MANLKNIFNSFFKLLPFNILFAFLFFVVGMVALNSERQRVRQRVLGMQTEAKANRETILKWEQIVEERPNYRDGWVQLAVLYYKNGNKQKAKEALSQAKQVDPNNENLIRLEKLWNN